MGVCACGGRHTCMHAYQPHWYAVALTDIWMAYYCVEGVNAMLTPQLLPVGLPSQVAKPTPSPLGSLPPVSALVSVPLWASLASTGHQAVALSCSVACPVTTPAARGGYSLPTHPQHEITGAEAAPGLTCSIVRELPAPELSLSRVSEPFLPKLVERIRAGHFVEMRDLLTYNISLIQQMEAFNGNYTLPALPGMLKPRL